METTIQIDRDIIVLTTKTVEFLLSGCPDSLVLYIFYMKNAKIQETNSIWNTNTFGMKGLGWGVDRYNKAKKFLIDNGFIDEVKRRNDKGQIEGHYLKINYLFKKETVEDIINQKYQKPSLDKATTGFQETNALSNKSINALTNKKKISAKAEAHKKEVKEYNYKEEVDKLLNSNWKVNKIIALYFLKKRFNFENQIQFNSEYKRNLRPAKELEGYNSSQIEQTMNYLEDKGLIWTLNAIGRNISNVVNKK